MLKREKVWCCVSLSVSLLLFWSFWLFLKVFEREKVWCCVPLSLFLVVVELLRSLVRFEDFIPERWETSTGRPDFHQQYTKKVWLAINDVYLHQWLTPVGQSLPEFSTEARVTGVESVKVAHGV